MQKNSRIECLKIIATILIVICHSMPDGVLTEHPSVIEIGVATSNIQHYIMNLIMNLGQIGNVIFIVCSSWFLLEKENSKTTKILHMIGDCTIIAILFVLIFTVSGYKLPTQYIIKQFLIIIFEGNWFVTCYLLFYIITPYLNLIINKISQAELLLTNCVLFAIYSLVGFIINIGADGSLHYTKLVGFVIIYFIVAYIKKYLTESINKKTSIFIFIFGISGWLVSSILINQLGLRINFFSVRLLYFNQLINPFYFMIAIGLFCVAKRKVSYNKIINSLSGLSLLIYLFNCNRIIRDYIRYDIYEYIYTNYSYNYLLIWILLFSFFLFLFSLLGAIIYRFLFEKIVHSLFEKLGHIINRIYMKVEKWLLKF